MPAREIFLSILKSFRSLFRTNPYPEVGAKLPERAINPSLKKRESIEDYGRHFKGQRILGSVKYNEQTYNIVELERNDGEKWCALEVHSLRGCSKFCVS